jgi:hypothetical protein
VWRASPTRCCPRSRRRASRSTTRCSLPDIDINPANLPWPLGNKGAPDWAQIKHDTSQGSADVGNAIVTGINGVTGTVQSVMGQYEAAVAKAGTTSEQTATVITHAFGPVGPEVQARMKMALAGVANFSNKSGGIIKEWRTEFAAGLKGGIGAVRQAREGIDGQFDQLMEDLKSFASRGKRIGHDIGQLTSKALQKALHSGNPLIRKEAREVQLNYLTELSTLVRRGHGIGVKGMEALHDGLKSKEGRVRAAARQILDTIDGQIDKPAVGTQRRFPHRRLARVEPARQVGHRGRARPRHIADVIRANLPRTISDHDQRPGPHLRLDDRRPGRRRHHRAGPDRAGRRAGTRDRHRPCRRRGADHLQPAVAAAAVGDGGPDRRPQSAADADLAVVDPAAAAQRAQGEVPRIHLGQRARRGHVELGQQGAVHEQAVRGQPRPADLMSGVFRLADSPVPALVAEAIPYETYFLRPTNGLTSRALGCESGLSTIVANDPDATMTLTKWHAFRGFRFEETDCANLVVFQGNMTNRTLRRGSSERTEDARVWDIQVADFNFQMKRRVIRNADGNRPAETDIARLEWLLASDYTVNTEVIVADGIFDSANPVTMTANDYRGRFPVDVVTDCMGYSGKNAFVYAKPDGGDTAASWVGGFAYFVATDNIYTSSIKISNLLSDVDSSTIYAGSNDATLEKNAERVFSGVYLTYSGGKVYRQLQSTIDAYGRIDASIDMPDIKTAAAATALADRYLNDYSFEEDIINVALLMPADKVNLILEGHAVQIKQTHWLGYEDYVWRRVAQRTVSQTPNPAKYLVNLELRDPRLIVGGNGAIPIPAGDINNQLPPPPTTNTFAITTCADKPATSFATVLHDDHDDAGRSLAARQLQLLGHGRRPPDARPLPDGRGDVGHRPGLGRHRRSADGHLRARGRRQRLVLQARGRRSGHAAQLPRHGTQRRAMPAHLDRRLRWRTRRSGTPGRPTGRSSATAPSGSAATPPSGCTAAPTSRPASARSRSSSASTRRRRPPTPRRTPASRRASRRRAARSTASTRPSRPPSPSSGHPQGVGQRRRLDREHRLGDGHGTFTLTNAPKTDSDILVLYQGA